MPDTPKRAARQAAWERNRYRTDPAYRERAKDSVKNKVKPGDGDPRHGKVSTYNNHKCRCPLCRAAAVKDSTERRRRNASQAT